MQLNDFIPPHTAGEKGIKCLTHIYLTEELLMWKDSLIRCVYIMFRLNNIIVIIIDETFLITFQVKAYPFNAAIKNNFQLCIYNEYNI